MGLLIIYIGLVIVGDVADYLICLTVERYWPSASLPVFLALYFVFLWVAWVLAVKLTAPRAPAAPANAAA
jgi:hypothetical protein